VEVVERACLLDPGSGILQLEVERKAVQGVNERFAHVRFSRFFGLPTIGE
jgi:hypothetical protein